MTCWKTVSFETRLSDRKVPPGSENSVISIQNVRSSSRCGSASPRGVEVGVTHSRSAHTASARAATFAGNARVIAIDSIPGSGLRIGPEPGPGLADLAPGAVLLQT